LSRRAWLIAALSAIGLVMAVRFGLAFPWSATVNALADADPLLLAGAAGANIISLLAKGVVWYLLVRRVSPVRLATVQSATLVAAAVNSITVAGSGEAVRGQLLHDRDGVTYSAAFGSLVATRIVEAMGLVMLLALAFSAIRPAPGTLGWSVALLVLALALIGCVLIVSTRRWHPSIAGLVPERGLAWIPLAFVAALNWGAQWIAYHWSIEATHVAITPAVSLTALVAANLAGILRLTPGNVGVIQGSIVLGLEVFKIPAAQALAGGLALQAVQVLPVLAIALAFVGARGFRQLASQRAGTVS
jgi:uncharacterized membrane protein YbhN (UPF0104 family)